MVPGDHEHAARDADERDVALGELLALLVPDGLVELFEIDVLGGLPDEFRSFEYSWASTKIPNVLGAVVVVVVHLGNQGSTRCLRSGSQHTSERLGTVHPNDAGANDRGRSPRVRSQRITVEAVAVQRQHQLEAGVGLTAHGFHHIRKPIRPPRRSEDRYLRRLSAHARCREDLACTAAKRVVAQGVTTHLNAELLATVTVGIDNIAGHHQVVQRRAEARCERRIGCVDVHDHSGPGEGSERSGSLHGVSVVACGVGEVVS